METETEILEGKQKFQKETKNFGRKLKCKFWKENKNFRGKLKILEGNQNINFGRKTKSLEGNQKFWKETKKIGKEILTRLDHRTETISILKDKKGKWDEQLGVKILRS